MVHIGFSLHLHTEMESLKVPRTLNFFLRSLCGQVLTVELRNGVHVRGGLDSIDTNMKYVDASVVV